MIIIPVGVVLSFLLLNRIGITRSDTQESPVLASGELLSHAKLTSMHEGTFHGYHYNFLYNGARLMAFVQLGYKTGIHVVATGDKAGPTVAMAASRAWLTPVRLEGDFPAYFQMYCSTDKEIELLTIFDPADMAYFVDFCRLYNFEIFHDTLYVSQIETAKDEADTTTMIEDVETFLKKNDRTLRRL
jgi:hypothetical protein